ncbi:ABC transporter substrate-binding protein [Clostridium merdae]|uniref:ABC transporter substrate-binding protein n=1 Tax=Clostridium merdae TaxID=1958780 RepID=UPI000A26DE1F|nr:NrtA/SsuA/CpmA family ABC transporter substrate-binding protein [Clostridium merdae]
MKRILSILMAATIAAASLSGCGVATTFGKTETSQVTSTSSPEFTVNKIGVTYVKSPLNVPSIVEKEKGIFAKAFEEYNLPVEYSNLTSGPEQTQALASGDIQFLYAVGATSVILSASNGADIKILNTYSRSPEAFRMFAGKDSKINTAADLKGKKIAGPKGTILHELMVAYLATAGLTEKDVEFVSMGIPDAQAALAGGTVDCALLAGPTAYNVAKDGFKIVTTGKGLVDATIVVATSQSFYDKNPLLVKRFLQAEEQIQSYMKENTEDVLKITAKETELSMDAVKEMYPMYDFKTEITDADIASMKKTEKFMKDNKMIENNVDIDQLILEVK